MSPLDTFNLTLTYTNKSHDVVQPSFEFISSLLYSNWIPGHYSLLASNEQ